ncbi:MAG TPA: cell division protein ZipA C-terminal FtsZ-binding domain-containing protein [Steroidobacteraceae bacterium]|nr:cell division protein ZipA C-terminal FtsZ-binding domain-containing protein [Steroidobacteraceae bacterium]
MPELRVILLIAGVLLIAGIAGVEWWRSRRDRPMASVSREDSSADAPAVTARASLPLPEISMARETRSSVPDTLPVIELRSAAKAGPRDSGGIAVSPDIAVDAPAGDVQPDERPLENTSTQSILRTHDEPYIGQDDEISEVRTIEFDTSAAQGPTLSLAWPPENERRIVTLRVLPVKEPRFPGRNLRQAFASAGFWHGPLDIFHLPDPDGRVVLSAAALAQPGTFDPSIMDSQRFSGINLFAVLPGPMPERETFDELVHAARQLSERLDGQMTDQHGEELTSQRISRLRQSLDGPATARAAGES